MRIHLIKLIITLSLGALFAVYSLNGSVVKAYRGGPPAGHTGAPGELTCAVSGCHSNFPLNSGLGTLSITGLPATYTPDQEITVTVTLNQSNRVYYGFQVTALDAQNNKVGELSAIEPARTIKVTGVINSKLREYITHLINGTTPNGVNQNSWTFRWKAPAQSAGQVTFYAAGNAADGSNTQLGDFIYTKTETIQPAPALTTFASVSAASFSNTGGLAADGIVAGFGTDLASGVLTATTIPLPTQLGDTQVVVKDANGDERLAGLFFVAPTQVNYLIPPDTANGAATITVRRNGVDTAQGTVTIEEVSPGLFTANSNGQGAPAAVLFRRRDNVDTFELVAQFNETTNSFEPVEIDLGPETDQVFLIAFGTGFRKVGSLGAVTVTIGGTDAPTLFAGAVGGFEGLDQANIALPHSLAGRGLVDVVFSANGKMANTVKINIK